MLDVGWTEILVIAIVLIIVVGPKDLPQMLRTFGRMVSKMRGMASDFRQQFDEALREADLDDVRKTIGEAQKLNPLNTIREAVNPLRQMGDELKADLQKSTSSVTTATPSANPAESVSGVPVAVPSEAGKPASAEPVSAAPLKTGPVRKTAKKKADDGAAKIAKPRKAAAKPEAEPKKAAAVKASSSTSKAAPAKTSTAKTKTAKTKKGEA
ncbi:Sec-independent protein translocase protein TatB [Shinella curvata]|uniref:Sec-independent protein translocase protein TatB n=1 Tax=Shinella curvata TaxID=1817964 RepID=A0ABT8X9C1_9HYPH|nr:Sec-independent protein translocase protein TatB [Shinella curvata]MCJ8051724.1 Sec-independent protein translocase protein TatB [Shinella curvata]MDO6120329.1 Sec-independent protein translocase protein TatB [Shinella curvata]